MIFSVLEKIERGERAFDDRELRLLLPYIGDRGLRDSLGASSLLQLQKLVKGDKDWEAEVNGLIAYDLLFGAKDSPVLDGMVADLLMRPGGNPLELVTALQRAAQDEDRARLRRITGILMRMPDGEDGRTALARVIMHDDYLALRLAAAGPRDNMRHLLNGVLNPGYGRPPVDEAAWMLEENRMGILVSLAAGKEPHRQETADMLLDRAKRAGVEEKVLKGGIGLLLYYAAQSGDAARLRRVWARGIRTLGAAAMFATLTDRRNDIITALALDTDGTGLDRLLALAERDLGADMMKSLLLKASRAGYGSQAGVTALLEGAQRAGGQPLVDQILRADNYQIFRLAAIRDDTKMLTMLERYGGGNHFMQEMLRGPFLAVFAGAASKQAIEYMIKRAHALCGTAPVAHMLLTLGQEAVAGRSDLMSVIAAIQQIGCVRYSGLSVALPASLVKALQDYRDGLVPKHEFWQRVGGDGERWTEVTNGAPPRGVNPFSSPWQFKRKVYEELLPHIQRLSRQEGLRVGGAEQIAYRYAVMFPNAQEAERYIEQAVRRARPDGRKTPFAEASDFVIPGRGVWTVAHWRGLLARHGRAVARLVVVAPQIEEYCAEHGMPLPRNTEEAMDVARFVVYKDAEKNPEFARLSLEYGLSQELFLRGLGILQRAKSEDALPVVTIDGADIGKPNYYMQKLPANDPRGLVLGHITNNCQTLGNNGEYAAIDGMTKPDSGFYVWRQKTKGRMTPDDRIVAQSWAWLAPSREGLRLVFDSYERLSPVYNHLARPFLEQYAHDTTSRGPLAAIFLGAGGGTPPDLGLKEAAAPVPAPASGPPRPDSARQYAIAPVNHRKPG